MIRLTGVELRRLISRRLTVIGVAALLLITGILLFATWNESKPPSAVDQQMAQVSFEQAQKDFQANGEQYRKDCEASYQSTPDPKPKLEEFCQINPPTIDQYLRPPTKFTEIMPDLLLGSSYLLAFAAFVIGASFVGAEFSSGSISNWLTFEPRRLRVYGSKLLAAATGTLPIALGAVAILLAGTYAILAQTGITAGTTGKVWGDLAGTAGRAIVMAAAAGALGGIFALLLRHTAAAVGVAMGYIVLVEGVFAGFLTKVQPWLVKLNFDAWIKHDTTYYVDRCHSSSDGGYSCESIEKTLSFEHGVWYLGIAVVVLVVLGAGIFHRRDIS